MKESRKGGQGLCTVADCGRVEECRGMCQAHYLRWRKDGDARPEVPIRGRVPLEGICLIEGCNLPRFASGWCSPHYNRWVRYRDPLGGGAYREVWTGELCKVKGCPTAGKTKGYCGKHYARLLRYGDPTREPRKANGSIHRGYRYIHRPGHPNASKHGWIPEHRLVMSEFLGRPLLPSEDVHHKHGNKLDNQIENLELWTKSHPRGQRVADKLAWAREILALYEPVESRLR